MQCSESEQVDRHFEKERDKASKIKEPCKSFVVANENAMEDMNRTIWIPRTYNFLDLGLVSGFTLGGTGLTPTIDAVQGGIHRTSFGRTEKPEE